MQPIDFTKVPFNSRTADKFVLRMPEGMRSAVEDAAAAQFGSMNSYMLQAIAEKLDRDQRAKVAVDALVAQAEQRGAL